MYPRLNIQGITPHKQFPAQIRAANGNSPIFVACGEKWNCITSNESHTINPNLFQVISKRHWAWAVCARIYNVIQETREISVLFCLIIICTARPWDEQACRILILQSGYHLETHHKQLLQVSSTNRIVMT